MAGMLGIYMSGTGNTRHCVEKLVHLLDARARTIPMEDGGVAAALRENRTVMLGYPVQFSNAPMIARDFVRTHAELWRGKRVLCVATMGAFSGDGAGCLARMLQKYGAHILGGVHIRMSDSVCDVRLLKKSREENRRIVLAADRKLTAIADAIRAGQYPKDGLHFACRIAGLFGQRLWFSRNTRRYSDRLRIHAACARCGRCASICPMRNIAMRDGKPVPGSRCTMCYRCISQCPQRAITLLGKTVHEQCRIERYL